MRIEISKKVFWDSFIYNWSGNKARCKRRKRIQKAKRVNRRTLKMNLKTFKN